MDAVGDPAVREIWVMKSSQVGWTEILGNVAGYYIHLDPSPMMLIQPTLEMGEAWSKDRLAPMLRDTPGLRNLVRAPKSRDSGNTLLHKQFYGGHITIIGANAETSLASRPIRILLCDEVDRYPSGGKEGDPIKIAQKRSTNYWNRRFLAGSTPTVKGASRVEIGYESSDKRRFFVPCPHCGEYQVLKWANVKWPDDRPEDAYYACEHCGAALSDGDRVQMVRRGEWRATAPFRGVAGFHIWEAYSPWRKLSEIVSDFLAAKAFPELLKVWVNTSLGETWEDREGEQLGPDLLAARAEDYQPWTVPVGALLAVAGVDVQHDRLEVGVYAFGAGEECWAVAHEVIYGEPAQDRTWAALDELLAKRIARDGGTALPITASCVDAGDGTTSGFVLDYTRGRRHKNVIAVKGQSQPGKPEIGKPTKVDVNVKGGVIKRGAALWPVGSDRIKGTLAARLREEGFIHFPRDLPPSYFEQLTAERLVTKFTNGIPRKVWLKSAGARNEALDCLVYAYAAAIFAGLKRANWKAIEARIAKSAPVQPIAETSAPAIPAAPTTKQLRTPGRRPGGFVTNW